MTLKALLTDIGFQVQSNAEFPRQVISVRQKKFSP